MKKFSEYLKENEIVTEAASLSQYLNNAKKHKVQNYYMLIKQLVTAVSNAADVGKVKDPDGELFTGTEGNDVAELLEMIYNALLTGNPNSKQHSGEIFK